MRLLKCADDNFLTQVRDNLTREDGLLELLVKRTQEMFGDREVESSLDCSNHETVELKMFTGVTKTNNYNTELQKNFSCPRIRARAGSSSRITSSEHENVQKVKQAR